MTSALNDKERQTDYHGIFTGMASCGNVIPGADESTERSIYGFERWRNSLQSREIAKAFRRVQNFLLLGRHTGSASAEFN
jgi:hypothetical protein